MSLSARFLLPLLCEANISDFLVEVRGRPAVVAEELVERREDRVDVKERVVEEDISWALFLGLRMP